MKKIFQLSFVIFLSVISLTSVYSSEEIIKERKAIFSKNYNTAKAVSASIKAKNFDQAKKYLSEMSENYKKLPDYFPENSKTGFKTEALPSIWENKDEFNALMQKSSSDVLELAKKLNTETSDLTALEKELMWGNCTACHKKFRVPQ
ncbi:MAG: cytochrome c [Proteobacteria bacterium]|nr:cytochrome c [Pseudomonadota bacterium]